MENDWLKNIKRNKKIIVGIMIYLLIILLIFFYDQLIFYIVVLISAVLIEILVVLYIVSDSWSKSWVQLHKGTKPAMEKLLLHFNIPV